jgi:KUP system potassium uptake protein
MDVVSSKAEASAPPAVRKDQRALIVAALGIVFGDIGTSPLYAMRECFIQHGGLPITHEAVLGVLSLIVWSLIITVTIKYVIFIMRADNEGEGGILALSALALRGLRPDRKRTRALVAIGIAGAALFYGDIIITPAMSVLGAVEGLKVVSPLFETYVIPAVLAIVVFLFVIQRHGTARVGRLFGPVMGVWFVVLTVLGLIHIVDEPSVLAAVNPVHAARMLVENGWRGFLLLGSVVLAITGGEALYADMGHLGRYPIRFSWFAVVLPSLIINYFGQGAMLLGNPDAIENPFFLMAPSWALMPLLVLATLAAVIASQAVISGAYSVTQQAINLRYLPRMEVQHTSEHEIGQIYLPQLNWLMLAGVIALVAAFRSSSALSAAYGIAVTGTMVATTILAYVVARRLGGWKRWQALAMGAVFLTVDLAFFSANLVKIGEGGWFPLAVGAIVFGLMTTWRKGREELQKRLTEASLPLDMLLERLKTGSTERIPGTAVYLTRDTRILPAALMHSIKHFKVLHQRVVLMTVEDEDVPHVPIEERCELTPYTSGFYRLKVRFGFKDTHHVPETLAKQRFAGLPFDPMETSFVISRETLLPSDHPAMTRVQEAVFIALSKTATSASEFFHMPPGRVVELGMQVEI